MKSKSLLSAVLISATILFNSCNKKDDSSKPPTPVPIADFTYTGANVQAPAAVHFTNYSSYATSYLWNFGDSQTSTSTNPSHTYTSGGVYTVKLTAYGEGGSASTTQTINIQNTPTICKIVSIKLKAMPFVDGSGVSWDTFDGPDVFFQIANDAGTTLYDGTASRYNNISSGSLPLTWTLAAPFSISPLNSHRNIYFYDYDTLDPDDYIGGVGFTPSAYAPFGYPTTVDINYQGVSATLTLLWL